MATPSIRDWRDGQPPVVVSVGPTRFSRRWLLAGAGTAVALGTLGAWIGLAGRADHERGAVPSARGRWRWPAEWEPHQATLMSMPLSPVLYGRHLADAQREWAEVARAIAAFEPVTLLIPPRERRHMGELLGPGVDLLELPYDDGWLRDNGPIFVSDGASRIGLDWRFNGWGGAFSRFGQTWRKDDALPEPLCEDLGIPSRRVAMVLEGGSVQSDGEGTILTTEECLLNPNRNPSMTKTEIEGVLEENLHAQKVIWLPYGLLGDLTSGHVDGVCMFIEPGRVLAQTDSNDAREQRRLEANLAVLRSETDARGRSLEIVEFPILPRARFAGGSMASHAYINFAFANGGLVVPLAGAEDLDRQALGRLRAVFPDRQVVGIPTPTVTWAGGGAHCITQQLPALA